MFSFTAFCFIRDKSHIEQTPYLPKIRTQYKGDSSYSSKLLANKKQYKKRIKIIKIKK